MKKRLECRITGRVQMVMFRDFAQRKATRSGITGFVKNNPDGSVTMVAEGEDQNLQTLLEKLKQGPLLARVDHVEATWTEARGDFSRFDIVF